MTPDEQIIWLVSQLKGAIGNWQIIAPEPDKRIIFFEMQDGNVKADLVQGYQKDLRDLALGEKQHRSNQDGKNRRTRNKRT